MSSPENAAELARTREELRRAKDSLETKVAERTVELTEEIAERKRLQERFEVLFHASPVGIAVVAADGRLTEVNTQLCEFFGYSRGELLGHTLTELGAWVDPEQRTAGIAALVGSRPWTNETRFRARSGEIRTALVWLRPLHVDGDAAVISFVDLTERKALELELQRFHRTESVGRLASGIAHDMNNILAPIIMGTPLLRGVLSAAEAEKVLATIEASAQRGAALMRQLLIFSRGIEGARRPTDPRPIITEVVKICTHTFPRAITIEAALPDDIAAVNGDATQLHQVLLNLAVNARDAMPDGGRLSFTVANAVIAAGDPLPASEARPGRYVRIDVADSGTGVPADIADRIFEPFFTTKEVGHGTGLGLSSVLGIVKSHEGFVRVDSQPGRGTTFEVYLPAATRRAEPAPARPTAAAVRGNGELVMVVDDEEPIRGIVRDTLVRANYRVVSAVDGVDATAAFVANPGIALVITDVDMPLMDGINLTRVLQRMDATVKVVISTGLESRSAGRRRGADLESLGAAEILIKPYTAEKLLTVIHGILHPPPPGAPPAAG